MITRRAILGVLTFWFLLVVACLAFWLAIAYGVANAAPARCESVQCLRKAITWHQKHERDLERRLHHHTAVDLRRAIAISSDLFGVSERAMTCVAWAESGYGRQTTPEPSSGALGPFQWLSGSWSSTPLGRAGYSRLDPLAASLSTAQRVVIDGSWREWVTGRGCGL